MVKRLINLYNGGDDKMRVTTVDEVEETIQVYVEKICDSVSIRCIGLNGVVYEIGVITHEGKLRLKSMSDVHSGLSLDECNRIEIDYER